MPGAFVGQYGGLAPVAQARLAAGASTTSALAVPPVECLLLDINIAGYSALDIASLRFNGDNGANYYSRYLSAAAGGTTFTNNETTSTTLIRLFANTTQAVRKALVAIENISNKEKICTVLGHLTGTGSAAIAPLIMFGGGSWVNTATQINSIELLTAGGANLGTGTSITIYAFQPGNGLL